MSQIYGAINANNNGNIYIVNAAGVEIGNSAQINVGSLYVSNRNLYDALKNLTDAEKADPNITNILNAGTTTDAALMSLGNINASQVTFDGSRIVIDTERLKTGDEKMAAENIKVNTTDAGSVVIGYDAYDETNGTYADANDGTAIATVNEKTWTKADGYMWVEDIEQLQDIDTNLGGNYALRNSIDATATQDWNGGDGDATAEGFKPIGVDENGKVTITSVDGKNKYGFYGKFDGLDYNIFNLNIDREGESHVGLFGVVHDAFINNVTFVGGSITGGNVVGSLAGAVVGESHISNITNSASVTGATDVGGIVGYSGNILKNVGEEGSEVDDIETKVEFSDLINTGTVKGEDHTRTSTEHGNNIGGLIGNLYNGSLGGTSYNLGSVTGEGHNVGGLVGHAYASKLGDGTNLIYNRLDVTGAYNVGGIVGQMEGTTVQNAENSGNVLANGQVTGTYIYHTDHSSTDTNSDGLAEVEAYIANAGGIAGSASGNSTITDVLNTGNVSSASKTFTETVTNVNGNDTKDVTSTYYTAGNVGGIVGSAVNTNITNATNRENEIRGAHNVGGIAGYFANSENVQETDKYVVTNGVNDGGDIMATGARNGSGFVSETIRSNGRESFTVGNMGGIVGYMDGNNVYIASSANRGTVHTLEPENGQYVGSASKAANAGGIVGKIDRNNESTLKVEALNEDYSNAAVSNSYNTGDVMGYTGIGGIAGMMYNGEIAGSYNLGNLRTTRQSRIGATGSIDPINMGGIVGDTTEESSAQALLYDVYNKGQIGDANYDYFGRHVGGIVGRLSGTVEKAYNTGAIYNGYNVVGGIAGWMYTGSIKNSFNTGNITVYNQNDVLSQMGGIVGATGGDASLTNVYNLGTLRSFKVQSDNSGYNFGNSSLGGIIGQVRGGKASIKNAYTTGNLYINDINETGHLGSMVGHRESGNVELTNTYYIKPETEGVFSTPNPGTGYNADETLTYDEATTDSTKWNFGFTGQNDGAITGENDWRWYKGTTPILNAFLPNTENYFSDTSEGKNPMAGISSIQYGTAYDPLLTIINAANTTQNLTFDWQKLGANNAASIAVYGAGLTLTDFKATGGSGYFGGLIYSEGALKLDGGTNDIHLGSVADLYGSDVTITTKGEVTSYGNIYATAEGKVEDAKGNVSITGGEVNLYGKINFSRGQETSIPGIAAQEGHSTINEGEVKNPHFTMQTVGDRYAHKLNKGASGDALAGDVTITATKGDVNLYYGQEKDGLITANDLTVTAENGNIYSDSDLAVDGNITFSASGEKVLDLTNIGKVRGEEFMDAIDKALQSIGVDMNNPDSVKGKEDKVKEKLTEIVNKFSDTEHNPSHVYVDEIYASLTNGTITSGDDSYERNMAWLEENVSLNLLHDFLHNFDKRNTQGGNSISFTGSSDGKITIDMWDYEANTFNLKKYDQDLSRGESHTLSSELTYMNINVEEESGDEKPVAAQDYVYIWVSDGDQLKGIQQYYQQETDAGRKTDILSYNFALKNDIDASDVTDYEAIGAGAENGYTGTFDGRDNRIIGLDTTKRTDGKTLTNAGIFDTIGIGKNADGTEQVGTVEDLRVYSGTFTGTDNAGAVAGVNKGNISNVTAFGNVVDVQNTANEVSYAGGIVGTNEGSITGASAVGTATQSSTVTAGSPEAAAGGIAGLNTNKGTISTSTSNSAVNASEGNATALGGVAGVNEGALSNVDSLGVTTGLYKLEGHNSTKENQYSDNVGGIAGTNSGSISNAYNESIVSGRDNVGGIIGTNESGTTVENVSNAASVTGEAGASGTSDYVGGLAGTNSGTITNGRNNGTITGNQYVGGLVGNNASADSKLENLVNDEAAAITGDNYVGGIAGSNAGTISAENQTNLINRGSITGQMYVGGVAGENIGTIEYVKSDINLNVRYKGELAKYFGGVAGINGKVEGDGETIINTGTITNATNTADIIAPDADFVGGIVGWNTSAGTLEGMGNSNEGRVEGASHVGGVAGRNDAVIDGSKTDEGTVGIFNSGVVIAHKGGAGGIFGENTGAISHAELTNNGIVSGTYSDKEGENGTGGIFGVNSGSVTYSSLKNEINGQVMGTQNVGGLIGMNTGDITGGRTDKTEDGQNVDNGYYKYQIYNNGTIQAGTWNDDDKDGIVDEGELDPAKTNSQNIAGLFGINSGKVTAGYNTGVIHASGSENVGGIAGTNTGTLNQVFNTVINVNEDGSTAPGSITGSTNVGGIAGTNSGTISDAYNTSAVTSLVDNAVIGSIVGVNDNNGTISNVYGSKDGELVVKGLVGSGNATHVYNSEKGFGEGGSSIHKDGEEADEKDLWRQYGDNNPILKVFLTQLTVNETVVIDGKEVSLNDYLNLVYNGKEQDINIQDLIDKGFITGPDGMKHKDDNGQDVSFVFDAHKNTSKNDDFGNSQLIYNTVGQQNVGKYTGWLASAQIAASGQGSTFNPNNLGYDIDLPLSIGLPSEYPGVVEPPVDEHWNFLFDDNPWDRNRDFRERKAEVHFVAGGMTL